MKLAPAARLGFVQFRTSRADGAGDRAGEAGRAAGRRAGRPVDARGKRVVDARRRASCSVPLFVTVMSKPIASPALTGPAGFGDLRDVDRRRSDREALGRGVRVRGGEVLRARVGRVHGPPAVLAGGRRRQADRVAAEVAVPPLALVVTGTGEPTWRAAASGSRRR